VGRWILHRLAGALLAVPIVASVASGILLCADAGTAAAPSSHYQVTDLGTLGGQSTSLWGINRSGQIAGWSADATEKITACFYNNGTLLPLGTLGGPHSWGYGINDAGQIVGASTLSQDTPGSHAFLYDRGTLTDLGTLAGLDSFARSINTSGQIVGYARIPGELAGQQWSRAFLYRDGVMTPLESPEGGDSLANDINDRGQIAGSASRSGVQRAVTWENGVLRVLDEGATWPSIDLAFAVTWQNGVLRILDESVTLSSFAAAINEQGQIVGWADWGQGRRAFLYSNGVMKNLGALGRQESFASDINNAGQVVGSYGGLNPSGVRITRPFLYSEGVMRDLNELIDADSGWTLSGAVGINNAGQIIAHGSRPGLGERALLLTPKTAPPSPNPTPPTIPATPPSPPPVSEATTLPVANPSGWSKANVTVKLAATTTAAGRSVKEIRYRLEGAQQGQGTLPGRKGQLSITKEGETRITFHAVDTAGQQEEPRNLAVRIDKTAPTVIYDPARTRYSADETLNVTCRASDALSGIADFTGRDIQGLAATFKLSRTTRFTATATDRAGNIGRGTLQIMVTNSFASLTGLTTKLVDSPQVAQTLAQRLANARQAGLRGVRRQKEQQIGEYIKEVTKLQGHGLTAQEAEMLIALTREL
jgi:probable HAF family extracellular repeat protein